MSPCSRRWVGLCLAPVLGWAVDGTLTLCGQSEAYWAGLGMRRTEGSNALPNYGASVNEVAPPSHDLLTLHPLAYLAGTVLEMVLLGSLILLLPAPLAL